MDIQLPLNLTNWLVAFLPIGVLLVLMLGFNWGLVEAGPMAWLLVAITGVFVFKAPPETIALESIKGIWDALTTVLYIVIPAILIYEVLSVGDAFEPFRTELAKLSPHLLLQILTLGWILASFFQSIAGLGTPMAICAPLLVGLGVRPLIAVLIPLVGHAWGNTFAIGVAWNCLKSSTDMPPEMILPTALLAAGFLWLVNIIGGLVICWLFAGLKGIKEGFLAVAAISLVHGGVQLALVPVTREHNTLVAAICGFGVVYLLSKTKRYSRPTTLENRVMQEGITEIKVEETSRVSLLEAMAPYFVLVVLMLSMAMIKPLKAALGKVQIGLSLPVTTTALGLETAATDISFSPLTSAGTMLFAAGIFGYFFFKSKGLYEEGALKKILINTMEKTMPSVIGITALVTMSKLMGGTGQTSILSHGVAAGTGMLYPIFAPFIGVLGAFLTSSNLASNLLFGGLQNLTAGVLGLNKTVILASQTAGGAIGNIVAPGNVVLGTTTTGILGREGEVLKPAFMVALFLALVIGLVTFLFA